MNLKEFKKHFSNSFSQGEIEYILYQELSSQNYENVIKHFK